MGLLVITNSVNGKRHRTNNIIMTYKLKHGEPPAEKCKPFLNKILVNACLHFLFEKSCQLENP